MTHKFLMGFAAIALMGCASTQKSASVTDRVSDQQGSMEQTEKLLSETQAELTEFSKRIEGFKRDSEKRANMVNKSRFDSSLDHLLLAVQRSQIDLRDLQARNLEQRKSFESRVNRALQPSAQPTFREDEEVYQAD